MGKPKDLFNEATNDAGVRTEGIIVAMIEWWIDAKGGLSNLESIADQCNFEAIEKKSPDVVAKLLFAKYDWKKDFLEVFQRDQSYFYKLLLPDGHKNLESNREHFNRIVDWRLPNAVAYRLFTGWWVKHDKRIKKERDNYKRVQYVMES